MKGLKSHIVELYPGTPGTMALLRNVWMVNEEYRTHDIPADDSHIGHLLHARGNDSQLLMSCHRNAAHTPLSAAAVTKYERLMRRRVAARKARAQDRKRRRAR